MSHASCVLDRRRAGILLHITSLPGGCGNGDLGQDAYRFVKFLANSGITVWQTLPTGPTHPDRSPYQCLSVHAGNPLLINLEWLAAQGFLNDLDMPCNTDPAVFRGVQLAKAHRAFAETPSHPLRGAYEAFVTSHAHWLEDFALFVALREELGSIPWQSWPAPLRERRKRALIAAKRRLHSAIERVQFEQFVFFRQWEELRAFARQQGVLLFGDMPIFVAGDSADVWSTPFNFDLQLDGQPRVVAGVPPDYFSATGQRWGNPHYAWVRMEADGFKWWIDRVRSQLEMYDWIRIDHFRGLEAFWEIPASSPTAMEGCWVKAPGEKLLRAVTEAFHGLPLIAEDLGIITPEVDALRKGFNIPGMLILQFAFDGGPDNPYLPRNHQENSVVYTGTHDNDTTLGWFDSLTEEQRARVYDALGYPQIGMPQALVEAAWQSPARLAVVPLQDVLDLNGQHRMNVPGTTEGNWMWRFSWDQLTEDRITRLTDQLRRHRRV